MKGSIRSVFYLSVIFFVFVFKYTLTEDSCPGIAEITFYSPKNNSIVYTLPPPPETHSIINVSTIDELNEAMLNLESHTTIMIADGIYRLDHLPDKQLLTPYDRLVEDVAIRGASGNREAVILAGEGQFSDAAEFGIQIFQSKDVLIADLTIRNVYYHCISIHAAQGAERVHLYNLHLIDSGEQHVKSNPDGNSGVANLVMENCLLELTNGWGVHPELGYAYGNAISAHATKDLIIRECTFHNLYYTTGELAGPAILVWRGATGTIIERNRFINCARGISLGLSEGGTGHTGGVIRNNFFYRPATIGANAVVDVAIYIESSNALILHNTIVVSGSYYAPIEIRYSSTQNVAVKSNILDGGQILERDGAIASIIDNSFEATSEWFVDMYEGNLHLLNNSATREHVINQVDVLTDVPTDIDGQPRPYGALADIGADEFDPETPTTIITGYPSASVPFSSSSSFQTILAIFTLSSLGFIVSQHKRLKKSNKSIPDK